MKDVNLDELKAGSVSIVLWFAPATFSYTKAGGWRVGFNQCVVLAKQVQREKKQGLSEQMIIMSDFGINLLKKESWNAGVRNEGESKEHRINGLSILVGSKH